MNLHRHYLNKRVRDGFALIASLSIMSILVLIAVALYSLSSVATKSADIAAAKTEAETNARMALMMAVGELQKQMGPDQRISANADILSLNEAGNEIAVANPHWTGVWDSWIAGDLADAPTNPNYPSSASHHRTIGDQPDDSMHPNYDKTLYFRKWLVSLLDSDISTDPQSTPRVLPLNGQRAPGFDPSNPSAVQLVGEVSLGGDLESPTKTDEYVSARLIPMTGNGPSSVRGRYGWWVGDESLKAKIMDNSYEASEPQSLAEKLFRQQAPASLGNSEIPGLENLADQTNLASIPSRDSLALINGATDQLTEHFHDTTTHSYGILADVREGGLKRDLSTILERAIDPAEVYNLSSVEEFERADSLTDEGEDFMLYNFDEMLNSSVGNTGEAAAPVQDLAAYYQLYDSYRPGSKGGIQYSSSETSPPNNLLNNGIMVSSPDPGETQGDVDMYLRQYTTLYRRPAVVKIEFALSYVTEPILPVPADGEDTHRLKIGVSPAVTYWNPNNVPMVMRIGDPETTSSMLRMYPLGMDLNFQKSDGPSDPPTQVVNRGLQGITFTKDELFSLFTFGNYSTVFEPGESKVFALRFASNTDEDTASNVVDFTHRGRGYRYSEPFVPDLELVQGWNPERFIRPRQVDSDGTDEVILTFNSTDYISVTISNGGGNSFNTTFSPKSRHGRDKAGVKWHFRESHITGPYDADSTYKENILFQGFPLDGASGISNTQPRDIVLPARSAQSLINAMGNPFNPRDDLPEPFFYYSLKAGTETHESNNLAAASSGAARRFVTRPFIHSTPMATAFIDNYDPASFYNYGWNWFFMPLDNIFDIPVEISGSNSGYYGGGYTAENGVTNIVQQQLPITPPIAIATLSHARLGGFSIATEAPAAGYTGLGSRTSERFTRTTVNGFGGLAPHNMQAIGNSYAHPNIPADKAFTTWTRRFEYNQPVDEPFADHSYLANKALWDDYFFSSISPKPEGSEAFSDTKTAEEVANEFFFNDIALPNPRIVPNPQKIEQVTLDDLFNDYALFNNGFADKIAAHLMVEGPFNINSTSVLAWKTLFSSLKEQEVSYLDAESALVVGTNLDFDTTEGVPIPGGPLPNGQAYEGSPSDPSDREQWLGFRELNEDEIDTLADAMVEQVKRRGPFLSLSEFVNRRLDSANTEDMALKGALQAAIDDPDGLINEGFIGNSLREFSSEEKSYMGTLAFDDAMNGPIAYGSAAYVDQADILRNFPAQLTPRGDTFVIRAYGDTLEESGNKVLARAWCEAVVQRIPDYVAPTSDEAHLPQSALTSEANKLFGRQFKLVSFRWLNPSEI